MRTLPSLGRACHASQPAGLSGPPWCTRACEHGAAHELGALLNDLDSCLYLRVERVTDCVTLRVRDAIVGTDSRTAAEALLRWRVDLERFGPQLRAASP
jgi:hypothetical protein